jgi:hypothetical protein
MTLYPGFPSPELAESAREWAECWKVDEAIEAIEYTKAVPEITRFRWAQVTGQLLILAPNAYVSVGVQLSAIWDQLPEDVRWDLYRAWEADYWPNGRNDSLLARRERSEDKA